MYKERKDISELLKEYYNRPKELQKENQKLKKKIDKLQKENRELKENSISKDKIRNKRNYLINEYSTRFVDNKDIYIAINFIDEILEEGE